MSEQQREEKQSRVSNFSHKALAQAFAATKGMPSIANTLRTISAIPPHMRCALAALAGRLALERLAPKPLQAFLHAEPPALLSYRGER